MTFLIYRNILYFSDHKTHLKSFNFLKNQKCALQCGTPNAVVPKLGVNYPLGVICASSGGNATSNHIVVLYYEWSLQKEIFDLKCEKFLLRVIRHSRCLYLGNGSNKFGSHWPNVWIWLCFLI